MMGTLDKETHRRRILFLLLMSIIFAGSPSCTSESGKVSTKMMTINGTTLSWTAPATYIDGSALTVASYNLYYGTSSGIYAGSTNISGTATNYDITQLIIPRGATYYFVLTALDAGGLESGPSNEVNTYVPN